ncbi:MAG TPA: PP2C family serine/threonine-protein phosphatase [Acidimicrobiales bacterium]|nr:PP2C family serine/threonine-protein phosphatase [Acidimicrobiales bacterium]
MGVSLSDWKVLGASVEGSGHRRDSTGCQDSHAWTLAAPDTLVAAVADGAGSARRAAEGSTLAATFSVEYVAWRLCEHERVDPLELLSDAMGATRSQLARLARRDRHPIGDLATTLALVIASPDGVWAAQVGDGSVVVHQLDGSLLAVADGEREEYLNETTFLTSKSWRSACVIEEVPTRVESIALLTDGLGLLALDLTDGGRPHVPFFKPLLGFARAEDACPTELERFLESDRVATRTDDDVTLLLATLS